MRYAAGIEYCGAEYSGWQRQKHAESIQAHVEAALSKVADQPIEVICAGRTDAGVHANYQVIHFDSDAARENHSWLFGCNSNLPRDISLSWLKAVPDEFHARFSALKRRYRYLILNRPARPGIMQQYVTWECRPLDIDGMSKAAECLLGEHDFTSFRAAACQAKSPVRHVYDLKLSKTGSLIEMSIEANAFLHHMVRNIAGVLITVGTGKESVAWVKEVLQAKNRECAGVTAPASGLSLIAVEYPAEYALPEPNQDYPGIFS